MYELKPEDRFEVSNKITIEEPIVADCIERKLNKIKECLKKGYNSIRREDLCQLFIYEEGNVNEFLAWDEKNDAMPLNGTKSDLIKYVIKAMNKKGPIPPITLLTMQLLNGCRSSLTWIWNMSYGIFHHDLFEIFSKASYIVVKEMVPGP